MTKRADATHSEQQARRQAFADALAGIIADDDTPASTHNGLIDWINEAAWDTGINMDTPEVLRAAVPLMFGPATGGESESEQEAEATKQAHTEAEQSVVAEATTEKDMGTESAGHNHVCIARHVSAILEHPDTPLVLRENILDALAFMYKEADTDPRHIAFILDTSAKGEALEGGAS